MNEICCALYFDIFMFNKTSKFSGVNKNINNALNADIIADSLGSIKYNIVPSITSQNATIMIGSIFSGFVLFIR